MPFFTGDDVFGIDTCNAFSREPYSEFFVYKAVSPAENGAIYSYNADSWTKTVNGCAATFNLQEKSPNGYPLYNYYGYLRYNANVKTYGWSGYMNYYSTYQHEQLSLSWSPSVNIPVNGGSIGVSPQYYYDKFDVEDRFWHNYQY